MISRCLHLLGLPVVERHEPLQPARDRPPPQKHKRRTLNLQHQMSVGECSRRSCAPAETVAAPQGKLSRIEHVGAAAAQVGQLKDKPQLCSKMHLPRHVSGLRREVHCGWT